MKDVGDVILTARVATGMTQEELRERIGVTQAALSRYENNLRTPDAATLSKLSEVLGVSEAFLSHPFRMQGALAADAHMRRQKSTKASDWKHAEARLNLLRMRSSFVFERIPMQAQNYVPTFDPEDTTPTAAALMVRAQWRMPVGPVRDLTRWVESAGVLVIHEDFGTHRIDGLSQWAAEFPVILVNGSIPIDRQRLTLAHELGHLVLHSEHVDADMEAQANEFASEFLMPEHVISPTLRSLSLGKLLELKAEWGVSMQALFERAFRLGRVSSDERQRFYRSMNARGWKMTEPGLDRLTRETPRLAAAVGQTLRDRGLTDAEIATLTGVREPRLVPPFISKSRTLRAVPTGRL